MKGTAPRSRARRPKASGPPPVLEAYQILVDHLQEPAGLLGRDGTLVCCNLLLDTLLDGGKSRSFFEFIANHSHRSFAQILARGSAQREELVVRTAGGRLFRAWVSVTPLDSETLLFLVKDQRQERLSEEQLNSGRLTRSILFQIGEAVAVVSANGVIVRASHAAYGLAGVCPVGRKAAEVLPLEITSTSQKRPKVWTGPGSILGQVLEGKSFHGLPAALVGSGAPRHVLLNATHVRSGSGQFTLAVFVFSDVTKVRETEAALAKSEAGHRQLMDILPEAILVASVGSIVFANPAGKSLLGTPHDQDVLGRRLDRFLPGDLDSRTAFKEHRLIRLDGSPLDVEVRTAPLVYRDKPAVQVIIRDISERKRAENEVKTLNAQLERRVEERTAQLSDSIQDLKGFSHSVAHDLRAPLRAMQGFSQALLEDYGERLEPTGRDFAGRIAEAARRMDALLGDLLIYSQLAQSEIVLAPVELSDVVRISLQQLEAVLMERNADVQVEPRLPKVLGHRTTLIVVLSNLISNAAKFTAPGVRPAIRVRATELGGRARIWVEDDGIGIAPEHQDRIFRIFERLHTREAYPGTGMGLAIVRRSLERLGGSSGVESTPGQGSRFWIELAKAP